MIGARVLPPAVGSPLRRLCSDTSRERFFGLRRGAVVAGLTSTSTWPLAVTPSMPNPKRPQIAVARVALAAFPARRHLRGQPYLVAGAGAVDPLQQEFEVEGKLQLANHDSRRLIAAQRHQ